MERDAAVQEGLRRSNARFLLSMSRILEKYNHPFEDDLLVSMDDLTYSTPDGKNSLKLLNLNVDDGPIQKKERRVQLDVIVQDDYRDLPKWITVTDFSSMKKKLELSNGCSSSKYLQLQHSGAPISSTTIAFPSYQPCLELSSTFCDSIHGEYQSADEECSWSNTTLADLYPAMVEIFTKLMTKHSQKKVLKYMFGHLRSKRRHSRRPKLNVTLGKMRGFRPSERKSTCGFRSEDNQSSTSGNESREFYCDNYLVSNSPDLMPYAYTDTNEIKTGYSNSSLEYLAPGKGQEVRKHTAFPDVMDRMGETFPVEDELHTTSSPKNSEYTENEKFAYKRFSETTFIIPTASSDSRALHVVEESETQKTDCVGTSELRSSACSSPGNSNNSLLPITNCSPARSDFMKQSPSKMPKKCKDAFEELYYKVCSEEFRKSLTLKRPCVNSQNLEEKGRLVKSNLSDFGRSAKQCDIEFDRIDEKLRGESVPKFPGDVLQLWGLGDIRCSGSREEVLNTY
uniref:Uncharacterized protein n=1 Tax=Catharus ustulatus TaxID=91951 RepID=A0A8C3XXH0_CATUS